MSPHAAILIIGNLLAAEVERACRVGAARGRSSLLP
jgi:hypothetical protein